jgi:hypothetical protein
MAVASVVASESNSDFLSFHSLTPAVSPKLTTPQQYSHHTLAIRAIDFIASSYITSTPPTRPRWHSRDVGPSFGVLLLAGGYGRLRSKKSNPLLSRFDLSRNRRLRRRRGARLDLGRLGVDIVVNGLSLYNVITQE